MKLCEIAAELAECELDLGKLGKIDVTYRPDYYTPTIEAAIHRDASNGRTAFLVDLLHRLFTKWSLEVSTEEEATQFGAAIGEMVPLTKEALAELPSEFLAKVFNAFAERSKASGPNS